MIKSEKDWKQKLTKDQYKVLREKGTEMPFTGKLLYNSKSGMYQCAGCGAEIFSSDAKFDSGTGWPSFTEAKNGSVDLKEDYGLGVPRTEVICKKCGGHLGHVFDDGPRNKGGKRFCINSCALGFKGK